ncbi:MAG: AarF/ABC1/UbiB kinase family protein [Synechococcales cyanobacterium RM1_1_8]|nr:AarF/ABC1/UbiB kinase family protein [Synechococcales cyanobacterium RM1_1_8]
MTPSVSDSLSLLPEAASAPLPAGEQLDTGRDYAWNRGNYSPTVRSIRIWMFVLTLSRRLWMDGKAWSYRGGKTEAAMAIRRRSRAVWIRESFLELGPTFIKLGQLFSTRADLFPTEYVEELSKLQDRVPAFSFEAAQTIIEADLGKPLAQLFKHVETTPLAAASLGQVHKAELFSGEEVVIKVQRNGLKQLFDIDLQILKGIARYFQNHPRWGKGRDWLGIYGECSRILWEEIDYLNEGRNADTFRRNFRAQDWVAVPRVYWRYSAPRVLTLEYMPGIKISNYAALEAAGLDRKLLARLGAEAYLRQILNDGLFHADPHPGNLAVRPDGSLIFYDFGMMGQIQKDMRSKLMGIFFGVAQKDANQVMKAMIEVGALEPIGDLGPVRRSIQYMLDNFMDQPFENQSVDSISDDLYDIAYGQPFRFPATFTFVMRAFSTLEGVGKGLDPDFNFMEVAKPFALDIMSQSSPNSPGLLDELGRQAAQVGTTAFALPRRIEDTLEKLEQGDVRVRVRSVESDRLIRRLGNIQMGTSYAIIFGSLAVSGTILLVYDKLPLAVMLFIAAAFAALAFVRLLLRLNRNERL